MNVMFDTTSNISLIRELNGTLGPLGGVLQLQHLFQLNDIYFVLPFFCEWKMRFNGMESSSFKIFSVNEIASIACLSKDRLY